MAKQNSGFSLGDGDNRFQSSSQASYQNPSSKPAGKQGPSNPNQLTSSFSLGQDDGVYESEAKYQQTHGIKATSSSVSDHPTSLQKKFTSDSTFSVGNSKESSFVTSSSSYGVSGQGNNNAGNYGRHGAPGARNSSSDSLISNQQSSNFVTSTAAAYPKQTYSSSSHSHPPPQSNFKSSNASYGSGASDNIVQSPKHIHRNAGGIRQESSNFQIGNSSDNSYATSNSAAYNRQSNQGGVPPQAVGTRQVTEQHKGLQRSSFNPITGQPQ